MIEFVVTTEQDKAYLLDLRLNTMVEHLENQELFLSLEQHQARVAEHFEHSHLVLNNGQCVGAAKFIVSDQAISLLQLQIVPKEQGKGLGTQVLDALKAQTSEINLTVLKSEPSVWAISTGRV